MKKYVIAAFALLTFGSAAYAAAPNTINHALGVCGCCDDPNCRDCADC